MRGARSLATHTGALTLSVACAAYGVIAPAQAASAQASPLVSRYA